MKKKEAHDEAVYLIKNYTDNWQYDIAQGCAELAHGIGIITDTEYIKYTKRIEEKRGI